MIDISVQPPYGATMKETDASVYIIVEGKISANSDTHIHGFTHTSGSAGMFMVSLSEDLTTAVTIQGAVSGSVFYAYRGGIKASNKVYGKALAGQKISAQGTTEILFDEGLKTAFDERGGKQTAGADITAYYESR